MIQGCRQNSQATNIQRALRSLQETARQESRTNRRQQAPCLLHFHQDYQ